MVAVGTVVKAVDMVVDIDAGMVRVIGVVEADNYMALVNMEYEEVTKIQENTTEMIIGT